MRGLLSPALGRPGSQPDWALGGGLGGASSPPLNGSKCLLPSGQTLPAFLVIVMLRWVLFCAAQSAPPALCATGRTDDLQSLLSIIEGAQEFVYVSVMSYLPTMEFSHPRR